VYLNRRFEEFIRTKIGQELNKLPRSEALEAMDAVGVSSFVPSMEILISIQMQRVFNEDVSYGCQ
jgi:hypothetical protein